MRACEERESTWTELVDGSEARLGLGCFRFRPGLGNTPIFYSKLSAVFQIFPLTVQVS